MGWWEDNFGGQSQNQVYSGQASSTPSASSAPVAKSSPSVPTGGGGGGGGNVSLTPKGYAYVDKYGFSHVVADQNTAQEYASPGTGYYSYSGDYGGGYASTPGGGRAVLPIPGAKNFGNIDIGYGDIGLDQAGQYSQYLGPQIGQSRASLVPSVDAAPQRTAALSSGGYVPEVPQWKQNLNNYKTNPQAGYAEIDRAGDVYNQKMAAGDIEGANAAHLWANQIRDALGLRSGIDYNTNTGASLIPNVPQTQTDNYAMDTNRGLAPPVPKYDRGGYTPVPAPYPSLKLSSGMETIIPTMDYQKMQYGLQDQLYNRDYQERQLQAQTAANANKLENQDWYKEQVRQKNDAEIAKFTRDANAPYSTGASGGLTDYQKSQSKQKLYDMALDAAKADKRLADTRFDKDSGQSLNPPDGKNYFTLPQLVDAYINSMGGGTTQGSISGNSVTDEELLQYLK
ncbi:MAG: hypothetical protein ACYC4H_12900 [Desulfocucumaceae bacterium]